MESAATIDITKQTLHSIGIILAVGSFCGFLLQKMAVPDILYLCCGQTGKVVS